MLLYQFAFEREIYVTDRDNNQTAHECVFIIILMYRRKSYLNDYLHSSQMMGLYKIGCEKNAQKNFH